MENSPSMPTTASAPKRVRKTKIEKEIEKAQESTDFMIPKSCFKRAVRDILGPTKRMTKEAVLMLQEETEGMIVNKLKKANVLAKLAKRDTLCAEDLSMVEYFEKRM